MKTESIDHEKTAQVASQSSGDSGIARLAAESYQGLNERKRIKIPLGAAVFQEHRKVSRWKSPAVLAACYIGSFLTIAGYGKLTEHLDTAMPEYSSIFTLALGALVFVLIAGIQGHLSILLHEGSHFLLHPNKRVNGALAELAGIPLLFTAKNYRALHLAHHEYSGDPQRDPERHVYKDQGYTYTPAQSWGPVIQMLLKDLFVVNAIRFLASINSYLKSIPGHKILTGREVAWFIGVHGLPLAIAFGTGFGMEYLVLWYGPLFTLTFFFLKLHIYGEHTGRPGPTEFQRTWHHRSNPLFDFFVYPIRSGFHLEHHLYPSIPWYNMKSFRDELMKHPEYSTNQQMLDADGYFVGKNTIWNSMIKNNKNSKLSVSQTH